MKISKKNSLEFRKALVDVLYRKKNQETTDHASTNLKRVTNAISNLPTLIELLDSSRWSTVDEYLPQIIGLGYGSTPELDDYLLGIIFGFYCFNKEQYYQITNYLQNYPFKQYTTDKSAQLFHDFLSGHFPKIITPLLDLLLSTDENLDIELLTTNIENIYNTGHSSGYSFLNGLLKTIEYFSIEFSY